MEFKIENLERETYGDLVERDLRLEVDVISGDDGSEGRSAECDGLRSMYRASNHGGAVCCDRWLGAVCDRWVAIK